MILLLRAGAVFRFLPDSSTWEKCGSLPGWRYAAMRYHLRVPRLEVILRPLPICPDDLTRCRERREDRGDAARAAVAIGAFVKHAIDARKE